MGKSKKFCDGCNSNKGYREGGKVKCIDPKQGNGAEITIPKECGGWRRKPRHAAMQDSPGLQFQASLFAGSPARQ